MPSTVQEPDVAARAPGQCLQHPQVADGVPAASTHPAWATRYAAQSSDETGAVLVTSPKLAPRAAEPRRLGPVVTATVRLRGGRHGGHGASTVAVANVGRC